MTEVTLQIPDEIYAAAAATAEREARSVEEVLVEQHFSEAQSPFFVDPRHEEMMVEKAAFEAQRTDLWAAYPNEYVAFHGGCMIDHDPDQRELLKRIQATYSPEAVVLITQVIQRERPPFKFRSALWQRDLG